jgi:hypothetical protein
VLEPDEGKLSSPVLRGPGASNGARLLHNDPEKTLVFYRKRAFEKKCAVGTMLWRAFDKTV